MGIYEKAGVRKIALGIVDWITWVRLYGFRRGTSVFFSLRRPKKSFFTVRNSLFDHSLTLRDNYSDEAIFKQVFLEQQYDFKPVIPIEEPSTILDGGANVGTAAVYFKTKYPKAEIIAIEPEFNNFELLKRNTEKYPGITCFQAGIWHKDEPLVIGNPEAPAASFNVLAGSEKGQSLPGLTIGRIMKDSGWDRIDILKLDIEGAEKDIFTFDACEWLAHTRLLIIELHDRYRPGCTRAVFKRLEPYNYTAYFHHENIFIYIQP
jgi:FkbM family methyltransferase